MHNTSTIFSHECENGKMWGEWERHCNTSTSFTLSCALKHVYYANFHVEFTITFSIRWFENTHTYRGEGKLWSRGTRWGKHFRFVVFMLLLLFYLLGRQHKEIRMQMQVSFIHVFIQHTYTPTGIDQFNLIFCSFIVPHWWRLNGRRRIKGASYRWG